ncbi:hypothetical protein RM844_13140 [Streptomyces sp. DSM 44915]|uniref:Uncharacterized protein n=1 Tax=Streptomyces chisholmiae TaxID=3075540 RepID=A0ABU2JR50_9ACTN|nr:hypothetical protein [Streptomyces sp. DSM 44915]MDT0267231.1 hypothetical protein [Streptomyces sp. DSM 44915]
MDRGFLELGRRAGAPVRLPLPAEEGPGLPVDALRVELAHAATTPERRARIWGAAVRRAQGDGEPWVTVVVGFAVPVLRRVVSRIPRGVVERGEVEQEMLAAVVAAVRAVDPAGAGVDRELFRAADRAAHRAAYAARRRAETTAAGAAVDRPVPEAAAGVVAGDEYGVLREAVRAGALTCRQARLIGRTRVGGESMTALAHEWRASRRQLYRYREQAERGLVAYLARSWR